MVKISSKLGQLSREPTKASDRIKNNRTEVFVSFVRFFRGLTVKRKEINWLWMSNAI